MERRTDYFKTLEKTDGKVLEQFRDSNYVGDTTFSMLYAWGEKAEYGYHLYEGMMALKGIIDGREAFVLVRREDQKTPLHTAMAELYSYCCKKGMSLIFEDVGEEELKEYRDAAGNIGKNIEYSFQEKYSDYLYETREMISMTGGKNKTKRGSYNSILRNYPDISFKDYTSELYSDCIKVFENWCTSHNCQFCYVNCGCERRAFERFMEIYDSDRHKIGLAYDGGMPLAFVVCEQINQDTVSYFFQKNARKIRGLTYWLGREIALRYENVKYINLGEDMGIEGLAMDKKSFHPCRMLKKYTVTLV